jgi:hypothetical protein
MAGFVVQEREPGLVASVHAVEIADRERARGGDPGVVEASEYLHRGSVGIFLIAARDHGHSIGERLARPNGHENRVYCAVVRREALALTSALFPVFQGGVF